MINPKEITEGIYKGRRSIGPGAFQTVIVIVRGLTPFYQVRAIVNNNDSLDDMPNPAGYVANGLIIIDERLGDL